MSNVPDSPEHDPQLAAAWREHSAEMPPVQLDAAILAAAHRAVGSAPRDAAKAPRGATSPQRWWMPLAAAATIGAVALGILQTAPHDETVSAPTASDMPAQPATAREQAAAAPEAQPKSAPAPAATGNIAPPPAAADKLASKDRKDARAAAPEMAASPSAASGAAAPAAPAPFPATVPAEPANAPATSALAPAQPAQKVVAATDSVAPTPTVLAAAPQPFPADKKAESGAASIAPERARAAPAPAEAERDEKRQRNEVAQSAPSATGAVTLAKSMARQDAAAAKAVDIDASIQRIRKLHDEGRLAEAAKELIALRAVAPDADQRLPQALRAWAATVKP